MTEWLRRIRAVRILLIAGVTLLVLGVAGLVIDRELIAHHDAFGSGSRLPTLAITLHGGYVFPAGSIDLANVKLLPVFEGVAAGGIVLLVVASALLATRLHGRMES